MYTISVNNISYSFATLDDLYSVVCMPEENLSDSMRTLKDMAIELYMHIRSKRVYDVLSSMPEDQYNTFYF